MNGVTRNVVPHAMEETKMSKKFKYSLRDMIVVKRNDACKTITLGMIVDLFMYYILNIMPCNRFGLGVIASEGHDSMDRDAKRFYKRSFKLCKKIERCFIKKLANLYVAQAFVVSYVDVTDALYESIDSVANRIYGDKYKALYIALKEFSLPAVYFNSDEYKDMCAFYGFALDESTGNAHTEDTPFDASEFIGDYLADQAD